jgi:two-component sensor histidine kinase
MTHKTGGKLKRIIILPFILIMAASFIVSWSMYLVGSRESVRDIIQTVIREVSERVNETARYKMDEALGVASINAAIFADMPNSAFTVDGIRRAFLTQLRLHDRLSILSVGLDDGSYYEAQRLADGRLRVASAGKHTAGDLVFQPLLADDGFGGPELIRAAYDPRARPWYQSAVKSGKATWTEPYTLYSNDDPAMSAAVPFRQADGSILGVTTAVLTLGSISAYLAQLPEAMQGIVYIIDASGRLLASSSGAASIIDPDGQRARARNHPDHLIAYSAMAAGIQAPGEPSPVSGKFIDFEFRIDSTLYFGMSRPFATAAGLDWLIITALREAAYTAKLRQLDRRTLTVLVLFLIAAIITGFFIVETFTRPLRILVSNVDNLVPGIPTPAEITSLSNMKNEIGRLAQAILLLKIRLDENFGALEENIHEKDILLKEVHHRVKNNLQIVSSILSLQTGTIADGKAREAFEECQDRIQAMALVHEEVYQTASFVELRMADYFQKISNTLRFSRAWGAASVTINVAADDEAFLPLDKAIPCGLITNELVTNALKHAFHGRTQGQISVCFSMEAAKSLHDHDAAREASTIHHAQETGNTGQADVPRRFMLVVADDGTGIAPAADEYGGVGGQLVQGLVSQLKGTIHYESTPDRGTLVRVEF